MNLFLTGEQFSAQEAKAMGLASEVVAVGDGYARAEELCQAMLAKSPETLSTLKRIPHVVPHENIESALQAEKRCLEEELSKLNVAAQPKVLSY